MAALTTVAPSCASCVFGAVQTAVLSYTSHVIETLLVDVIPHITIYANGSETTSYERHTRTEIQVIPTATTEGNASIPITDTGITYANEADITWTVGDATLTYPTTYIQYIQFAGATINAAATTGPTCAQEASRTLLYVPRLTNAAALIYPSFANASIATALPEPLLEYLDTLDIVESAFGHDLQACAALPSSTASILPITTLTTNTASDFDVVASTPSTSSSIIQGVTSLAKRFGGARREENHATLTEAPFAFKRGETNSTYFGSGTGTGTAPASTPTETTVPVPSAPQSSVQETHSTATVIVPITGRAIITSVAPSALPPVTTPVPALPDTVPATVLPSPGRGITTSSPSPGSPGANQPAPTPNSPKTSTASGPDIGNLLSGIATIATRSASKSTQLSGLLGAIGSVAAGEATETPKATDGNSGSANTPPSEQAASSSKPGFVVGSTTVTQNSAGQYQYGSQTLTPGATVVVGSGSTAQTVVLQTGSSSTQLVVGSSTIAAVPVPVPAEAGPTSEVYTAGGQTFTAIQTGSSIVIAGGSSTVTVPVGSAATYGSQTISVGSSGTVYVNGQPLTPAASLGGGSPSAVITASGATFTAVATGSAIVVADASSTLTLQPGAAATFEGQTVSAIGTTAVVVDGSSTALLSSSGAFATLPLEAVIIASGATFTAIATGGAVIVEDASSTLTISPGAVATFEGQTLSVVGATAIVVDGSSTVQLSAAGPTTSVGLGGYINSGINSASATGSATDTATASGGAASSSQAASGSGKLSASVWSGSVCLGSLMIWSMVA